MKKVIKISGELSFNNGMDCYVSGSGPLINQFSASISIKDAVHFGCNDYGTCEIILRAFK